MEPVIGIDLGTTNSVVATLRENRVEVIPDDRGNRLHPSVVGFLSSGEIVIGHAARARRHVDPRNTVYSAKRLIGQSIKNPIVRLAMSTLPHACEEGHDVVGQGGSVGGGVTGGGDRATVGPQRAATSEAVQDDVDPDVRHP